MNEWVPVNKWLPDEPGLYLVHSPSADPKCPMTCMAWYEPPGTGNMEGWQLMPAAFIPGITHWMKVCPPVRDGESLG